MNSGRALRAHRTLSRLAFSFMHSFAWIFVFLYFASFRGLEGGFVQTLLLYALSQTTLCLTVPFALKHLRHGMKRGMVYGTLFASAAFVTLGALLVGYYARDFSLAMVLFAVFLGVYRGMYRIPYSIEARYNTAKIGADDRVLRDTLIALMPALAGVLIEFHAGTFVWLLFVTALALVLSLVPLASTDNVYENFTWGYRETFGNVFARSHRRLVIAQVLAGVESVAIVLIWPIAIFVLVGFSFKVFGSILSLTLLATLLTRAVMQRTQFVSHIEKSPVIEAVIAASAWVARLTVFAPIGIVLVDVYAQLKGGRHDDFAVLCEHPVDGGLYLDEFTALKEEARALGKICIILVAFVLASIFSFPMLLLVLFILAGIAAVVSIYYTVTPREVI